MLEEDLIDEIQVLRCVDHPGIVKVFEFFSDRKRFFIISELYRGGDLYEYIQMQKRMEKTDGIVVDEQRAKDIIRQLLIIVRYLHSRKIVHRDIKPENIMFETQEQKSINIKLVDFGLAAQLQKDEKGEYQKLRKTHGTAYYIAPEILKKQPYDYKCDIWSCGVVLYCMLAGKPPYNGNENEEIFGKIKAANNKVKRRNFSFHVSDKAMQFMKKLLNHDVDERISATEAL